MGEREIGVYQLPVRENCHDTLMYVVCKIIEFICAGKNNSMANNDSSARRNEKTDQFYST